FDAYLLQKLTDRNLPVELVYLPMIESAYNPFARSRAGAVGLWQFMPSTARQYGLKVNWWVDDRRDPYRSTLAALDYLEALYAEFGRWDLAIAAYNVGEGKIRRALARTGGETFWDIERRLPRETRAYVPLFLAMYQIFRFYRDSLNLEDPLLLGLEGDPPVYDSVQVPRPTTLNRLARWAGVSLRTFLRLNPRYRRTATDPGETGYWIRLPRGHAERFLAAMKADHSPGKWSVYTVHRVRRGETLSHIARRYATSVRTLMRLNRIRNPRRLRPGQRLVVPPPPVRLARSGQATPVRRKRRVRSSPGMALKPGTYFVYRVRPGDTLYDLARVFKVPVRLLMKVNGIRSARRLRAGTTLKIPISLAQGS
ncbi:MAG: LysM peptidoglycan-binding domain-containing protein, partial [Candidatus Hydrothermae bacterium]|nr:LysM peptidoglycan-binding domain-containing protein [Candidatus Hydrothermae bacterium]